MAVEKAEQGPRGLVWKCADCGAWCDIEEPGTRAQFRVIKHSKRCGAPDCQPPAIEAEQAKSAEKDVQRSMRRAAKRGDLRLHFSEEQIQAAVKAGWLTVSDAMNQDF